MAAPKPGRACALRGCKGLVPGGSGQALCIKCKACVKRMEFKKPKELLGDLEEATLKCERIKKVLGLWV